MDASKTCYIGGGRITSAPPVDPKAVAERLDNLPDGSIIRMYENLLTQTVRDEANVIVAFAFRNARWKIFTPENTRQT